MICGMFCWQYAFQPPGISQPLILIASFRMPPLKVARETLTACETTSGEAVHRLFEHDGTGGDRDDGICRSQQIFVRKNVVSERLVVDGRRLDHERLMYGVLHDEEHADRDAALEEARALDRTVHLSAAAVPLPPETTPGDRREIVIARRVEDADVGGGVEESDLRCRRDGS